MLAGLDGSDPKIGSGFQLHASWHGKLPAKGLGPENSQDQAEGIPA